LLETAIMEQAVEDVVVEKSGDNNDGSSERVTRI